MNRHLFLFIFGYILAIVTCIAQDSLKALNKNAVYAEAGGNAVLFSLSYERMFYQKADIILCARVGSGIIPDRFFDIRKLSRFLLPFVEANLLVGDSTEFFETGLGFTYSGRLTYYHYHPGDGSHHDYSYRPNYFFLRLGYRYQGERGFIFRAAATPVFSFEPLLINDKVERYGKLRFFPWLGVTFGYSF